MKKTLIALAAVAATGAAFAQSSVTLYGVADISVGDSNAAGTKFQANANSRMNNGSSRFGLKGTEDLGGGLNANFNFEASASLADGSTATKLFDRAAFISLNGGFGEIAAGRRLTPVFFGVAAYELTGTANYSALAKQFNYATSGAQAVANAFGARKDGLVTYTTPSFSGLTATVGTVLEGNDAQKPFEVNVIYKAGPVAAALTYDKAKSVGKGMSLGGSYDLGVAKVAASFQDPSGVKKGFTLGVSAPMGPVTLTADVARATDTANKSTDLVLEAKYALSKRTFAYGVILRDGTKGAKTVNNYAVGLRHNF